MTVEITLRHMLRRSHVYRQGAIGRQNAKCTFLTSFLYSTTFPRLHGFTSFPLICTVELYVLSHFTVVRLLLCVPCGQ